MKTALALLSVCAALGAIPARAQTANDSPPPGITPATASLAQVLANNKAATGPPSPMRIEQWTLSSEGLTGTQTIYVSGKDTREDDTLGPFHSSFGELGGRRWRQNENGLTIRLQGIHARESADETALRNASRADSGVRLLGETALPVPSYVIEVNPPGGRKEWLFIGKSDGLLVRREIVWEDQRLVETYDDFRKAGTQTVAWHIHATDGRKYNDEDYKLLSVDTEHAVTPAQLAVPADRRAMYAVPGGHAALPVKIIDDRIIVTVAINGHNEQFQLDSGASGIVLNDKTAIKLGLKTYGRYTGATAGTYVANRAVIPQAAIGDLRLTDLVIEALPFLNVADEKTFVVGLLGYDFIAGSVIHIDYLNGKAEALDPTSFTAPPGAIAVPVALDDGVPYAVGAVAAVRPTSFIIDTGADRSTLFSTFAQHHPAAMADQGLGEAMEASWPFVDHIMGVGGTINVRSAQLKNFEFAGLRFPEWLFMVTQERKSFEGEDFDGLIGQDFLRNFDLYLDYSRSRVLLVPNDRFNARWPSH